MNRYFLKILPKQCTRITSLHTPLKPSSNNFIQLLNSNPQIPLHTKTFSDYKIYSNNDIQANSSPSKIQFSLIYSTLWAGISVVAFFTSNHYYFLLPLCLSFHQFVKYRVQSKYAKLLITNIELNQEQKENIQLYNLSGESYKVNVKDMKFKFIKNIEMEEKKETFVAVFDAVDLEGKKLIDLRILLDGKSVSFSNQNILKDVLRGDFEAFQGYEYKKEDAQDNNQNI